LRFALGMRRSKSCSAPVIEDRTSGGLVTIARWLEPTGDLLFSGAPGSTVVSELADTLCQGAWMSPHLATLRSVERMFAGILGGRSPSTLVGSVVRIQGVGCYDFNHNQRGRSINCIELHPIVSISR
jgi:hypothetical protein